MFDCTVTFEGTGGISEVIRLYHQLQKLECIESNVSTDTGICGISTVSGKLRVNDKTFKLLLKLIEMADKEQADG